MSRKSAYKQVLSIGTAVVLGFALFTGSLDGAPKLLSPQSDEQAAALAEKQNESPGRTDDEADLVARLESGTASSSDSQNSQDSGDGPDSAATDTGDDASADSAATPIDEVENPDLDRARGVYLSSIPDYAGNPYVALRADSTHPLGTPSFTLDEYERAAEEGCFKKFSKLDSLGRTRKALACVPNRSVRASAAISRVSTPPDGTSNAMTLFRARASTTAVTLSLGRSAVKTPTARISSPARAISTRRACYRLKSRFSTIFAIRVIMCSTASRPCITKRNLSAMAYDLKRNRSRTTARPSASTCTATTCSRMCRSTTPPAATRPRETRPIAPPVTQKMIRFPPSPRGQIRPPRLPRAAFSSAPTLQATPHATWRGPPHSARPAWPERHKAPAHSPRASW